MLRPGSFAQIAEKGSLTDESATAGGSSPSTTSLSYNGENTLPSHWSRPIDVSRPRPIMAGAAASTPMSFANFMKERIRQSSQSKIGPAGKKIKKKMQRKSMK